MKILSEDGKWSWTLQFFFLNSTSQRKMKKKKKTTEKYKKSQKKKWSRKKEKKANSKKDAQKKKKLKKEKEKKGKNAHKKKNNRQEQHPCALCTWAFWLAQIELFSTSFLHILGVRGENTRATFFPSRLPTKQPLKMLSFPFSLLNFPSSLKSLHYSILPSKLNFLIGDVITWGCSSNCHNLGMQ